MIFKGVPDSFVKECETKTKLSDFTITVEETDCDDELTDEMKAILDERLLEDESTDMSAEGFFNELKVRYGL